MITSLSVGGLMIAGAAVAGDDGGGGIAIFYHRSAARSRSEEHTSELQSHVNLVCRLLLEKKNRDVNAGGRRRTCAWCSSPSPIALSACRIARSGAGVASTHGLAMVSTLKGRASPDRGNVP